MVLLPWTYEFLEFWLSRNCDGTFLLILCGPSRLGPIGPAGAESIDDQPVRMECADHDVHVVAPLHRPALVGKDHPVGLAPFWRSALAQLADILHRGHHQAHPPLGVDERGLVLLVVQGLGLDWVQ